MLYNDNISTIEYNKNYFFYSNSSSLSKNVQYVKIFYPIIPDSKNIYDRHWGYYIPIFKGIDFINSCDYMVHAFSFLENVILVDKIEDADYVVIHPEPPLKNLKTDKKIIIIDYFDSDNQMNIILKLDTNYIMQHINPFLYFKRSCIDKTTMKFKKYFSKYNIINYAIKYEYIDNSIDFKNKDIDISCFFPIRYINYVDKNTVNRITLPILLKEFSIKYPKLKIHIGRVDKKNGQTYTFNENYFDLIKRSKIVITCNPPNWIGDFRLFEALAGKTLVFVDKMPTLENILIHKKHLIYYENFYDIEKNILHYLNNNEERNKISNESYHYCLNNHTYKHRANEILNKIIKLKIHN